MIAHRIKDGAEDVNKPVDKEGYLQKKSSSWFSGWENFYVTLKDRKLKMFKSDQEADLKVPEYVFNMDHFNIRIEAFTE